MDSSTNSKTETVVTKEFLEQALKIYVEKYLVSPGSNLGDGYTCIMHSIDVWTKSQTVNQDEPLHLLIKCFPASPARQQFLDLGLFAIELSVYQEVIPELVRFQDYDVQVDSKIRLPFAPFLGGKYTRKEDRNNSSATTGPLESYIIMTDLCKSGGFRLKDRFEGLDLDHYKLVIEAQATLHAVSWAYKCKTGAGKLSEKFPSLNIHAFANIMESGNKELLSQNLQTAENMFQDDQLLSEGLKHLQSVFWPTAKLYYGMELNEDEKHHTKDNILRKPGPAADNEEPWEVLLHGDAWSNNMLFRYDEVTGKPVEVIFIDLQICREGDPFADVNYTLYVSTDEDLRRKHLTSMLHLYYDTFTNICKTFAVPRLPGWSWEEFNRRFHRAKMFGMYTAVSLLPVLLKNPDEIVDVDNMKTSLEDLKSEELMTWESIKQLMIEFLSTKRDNPVLKSRLGGAVADAVRAGIL